LKVTLTKRSRIAGGSVHSSSNQDEDGDLNEPSEAVVDMNVDDDNDEDKDEG
jgi:hypothetical protein